MYNLNEILVGFDIFVLIALGCLYYSNKKLKRIITGIRSNLKENVVEAEVIADWTAKASKYPPNSPKGKAYRNRLREVGHPYRGD